MTVFKPRFLTETSGFSLPETKTAYGAHKYQWYIGHLQKIPGSLVHVKSLPLNNGNGQYQQLQGYSGCCRFTESN
jgi:hypothetical protein